MFFWLYYNEHIFMMIMSRKVLQIGTTTAQGSTTPRLEGGIV